MMNGEILLESEEGKGSKFTVLLKNVPIAATVPVTKKEIELDVSHYNFDNAKLLVADDIKENRDLVKEIFYGTKVKVITAEDGLEAIEAAEKELPDLILMDIKMPNLDGLEASKRIKENSLTRKINIVAFTASASRTEEKKMTEAGFSSKLFKPISVNELLSHVASYLPHSKKGSLRKNKSSSLLKISDDKKDAFWKKHNSIINDYLIKAKDDAFIDSSVKLGEVMIEISKELSLEEIGSIAESFDIEKMRETINDYEKMIKKMSVTNR